uniref:GAF domain-containing protein n=1 Tax=Chromera velia CCMP2878 TaxID=1169474 RepID=A0A0G4HV86_9ALVE|eukprot:Cvel_32100.t1-p1 / transcript=Cvel_32100.t1 / gene=Cvel_32100 / organism=Chromera_velia_CCMP2878 / gene_product=Transmembrane protein 65, putative / transcript_product=Transmembrane protein 65, putative / location=Cvel_scaffold4914:130-2170(+) / protein_length=333 / sequence_SO=supercontig / SO=protein_coding / is_pseudo=false
MLLLTAKTSQVGFLFFDYGAGLVAFPFCVQAGEAIDNSLGVYFGLATITSAAFGQIISDVSGVCMGGTLEAIFTRFGLRPPKMTMKQAQSGAVKAFKTLSAATGVVIGCLCGMTTLFFIDVEAKERQKREAELETIFRTIFEAGEHNMGFGRCSLYIVDKKKGELWTKIQAGKTQIRLPLQGNSLASYCARTGELVHVEDCYADRRFDDSIDRASKSKTVNMLCCPIFSNPEADSCQHAGTEITSTPMSASPSGSASEKGAGGFIERTAAKLAVFFGRRKEVEEEDEEGPARSEVVGVLQLMNKKGGFTEEDERLAEMMATHVGIFMKHVAMI